MNRDTQPLISFVIIGHNEGAYLAKCIMSVRDAQQGLSFPTEVIFVDGGSSDNSVAIAKDQAVDLVLGGDKRRRAAENRNLGLGASKGRFVQFVDGDMALESSWPKAAIDFLEVHQDVAAVCGNLREQGRGRWHRALEIDWRRPEGVIRYCGGAAMWRRQSIEKMGGFPEDVTYGEEPYLCWRIRNELGMTIYYLAREMAFHNLGLQGFSQYWARNVRVGATYMEIAAKCAHSRDRLWLREVLNNFAWILVWIGVFTCIAVGSPWVRICAVVSMCVFFVRKSLQLVKTGNPLTVSILYSIHVYFCKIPLAWGQIRWMASAAQEALVRRKG